ncbi:MAG TPA: FAD-dependent oxidoreductase [Roseiflexaceae bacterium]|nr:FAD-dependent oxidoreductase [Roseiflexaceae bacterium]
MTQALGTEARPLRVAIVGAGPAGFYAADALLKQPNLVCSIDFFNRFPTPFGLVREGVAPDHQSIKAVTRIYDKIAFDPRVRYFGNVTFGADIQHEDLKAHYDQIVYAVGAQADRRMNIPGEDLIDSYPATAFVGWYNGHPDYRDMQFDLSHERVVVVGNGNVAMDVTRILVTDPDELAKTDIADHALAALRASKVREVVMLGRRGPAQAAFTNAELKEFGELSGVRTIVDPADLELDEHSAASLAEDKIAAKNVEVLREFAARSDWQGERTISMRFLVSPIHIIGDQHGEVKAVEIEKNQLVLDENGGLRAKGIAVFETINTGMVLRSVGYRGVPLKGVPFDEASFTITNIAGRVVHSTSGETIDGEYVVGWAKRGPSGVIGTNKPDAVSTVAAMIEDLPTLPGAADENRDPNIIEALLKQRKPDYVTYAGWKVLDACEVKRGAEQGRPRVKVTRVPEMLSIIKQG